MDVNSTLWSEIYSIRFVLFRDYNCFVYRFGDIYGVYIVFIFIYDKCFS